MPGETHITDPERIAAYVDSAQYFYTVDAEIRFDDPPVVARTPYGAKVRAWLPTGALREVPGIELDEPRVVRTNADGVEARVWLPVSAEGVNRVARGRRRRP
jgi:hypothetical protein